MRNAFIKTLENHAAAHPEIVLIVGDLGFGVVENFEKLYPKQFLNAGVSEQNMTGVAAGMAMSGKTVFTYSIANFPILRPLEQVRVDVCYHNANVKIVGTGGGFHYYSLGATHHATEDIAIMRALPNMTIIAPADAFEAELATEALLTHRGPAYLRLAGNPKVHTKIPDFKIGKAITVRDGKDLTIISTGGMVADALQVAEILKTKRGLETQVISMHTIKPIDSEAIIDAARATKHIFTLEDHSIIGGLGGAVSEVLMESGVHVKNFKRFGIKDQFVKDIGGVAYIKTQLCLDPVSVAENIILL